MFDRKLNDKNKIHPNIVTTARSLYQRRDMDKEVSYTVGRCIITFEDIMEQIRECIRLMMQKQGLNNSFFTEVLIHDSTAKSLIDYLKAFIIEIYSNQWNGQNAVKNGKAPSQEFVDKLFIKLYDSMNVRNDLAHSNYWPIYGDGETRFQMKRFRVKATGLQGIVETETTQYEFYIVIAEFQFLANAVTKLYHNIRTGNKLNERQEYDVLKALQLCIPESNKPIRKRVKNIPRKQ
jgi:hypothetical protein